MRVSAIESFQRFNLEQQRLKNDAQRHGLDQHCWAEHQRLAEVEQARLMRARELQTERGQNVDIYA